jgi:hypothetical protein
MITSQRVLAGKSDVANVRVSRSVLLFQAPVKVVDAHVPAVFVIVFDPSAPPKPISFNLIVLVWRICELEENLYLTSLLSPLFEAFTGAGTCSNERVLTVNFAVIAVDAVTPVWAITVDISTVMLGEFAAKGATGVVRPETIFK